MAWTSSRCQQRADSAKGKVFSPSLGSRGSPSLGEDWTQGRSGAFFISITTNRLGGQGVLCRSLLYPNTSNCRGIEDTQYLLNE